MDKELVLWVDENDKLLREVCRDRAHEELKLHRETMLLLFTDPEHTRFWLQLRSPNKDQYPNMWTLTTTCHVTPKDIDENDPEGYLNAGIREAMEEAEVKAINLRLLEKITAETEINRAIAGIVVGEYEGEPQPDGDEVVELRLFDENSVWDVVHELTPMARMALVYLGILTEKIQV